MRFIKVTIEEAFPLFYSHVSQKCRRANDPATEGPFYAPGAAFFHINTPAKLTWAEQSAAHLRKDGYTVTVEQTNG